MRTEIINTGSELMLGRVLNTHQQWLCRRLTDLGYLVARQVAIADTAQAIQQAARESLELSDLVIVTGGLGPTADDVTRENVAELLGVPLRLHPETLARLEEFFRSRKRPMPESTRVQAMVPEGTIVLTNANGTAPGLAMHLNPNRFRTDRSPSWLIMLPGPPRELRPMFTDSVVPLLGRVFPVSTGFACRTLRSTGVGESIVEERLKPHLKSLVDCGLEVGFCARPGQVDVRLASQGAESERVVANAEGIVREVMKGHIYGVEDETLEEVVIRALTARKETLALAESCTGGYVAHTITNIPGASAVLIGGLVTYSNESKQNFLGVSAQAIAEHGAVSETIARQMAEGARDRTGATYALAVTGIAGPSGGSPTKPVGTVFIALAGPFPTIVVKNFNPMDRETFKQMTQHQALELLRRKLNPG
jgi:nicotinamide-nucleotide amidase